MDENEELGNGGTIETVVNVYVSLQGLGARGTCCLNMCRLNNIDIAISHFSI